MIITEELFDVLLLAAIALIFARVLGYLFNRAKQPAVIGEIIAGIILGAIVILYFTGQKITIFNFSINIPNLNFHSEEFNLLAQIGILFLLFISGLETNFHRLKKTGKSSIFVAIGGVTIPFLLGFITSYLFGFSFSDSIVVGLILTATSVGVTARTLMDLRVIDTDASATILSAAVIDDIIGILLLAFAIGIGSLMDAVWIGARILFFFLVFLYIGLKVIDKILDLGEKLHLPKALLSISLSIFLIYAFFADKAGISGIIGAFVAGILIGQNVRSKKITDDVKALGYGFFIPLFFVWVGSNLWTEASSDLSVYVTILIFAIAIIFVSIIGKIIGCGIGAKLSGMSNSESLQIGAGMVPRMELALIIATAAIANDILSDDFSHQVLIITILLTIVTTLLAPFLIKATFKNDE